MTSALVYLRILGMGCFEEANREEGRLPKRLLGWQV